jgi:hypothetical protein
MNQNRPYGLDNEYPSLLLIYSIKRIKLRFIVHI